MGDHDSYSDTFNDHTPLPIFRITCAAKRAPDGCFLSPLMTYKNASISASKHALDFLAWCLMSHHPHYVVVPGQERSLTRTFGEAHRNFP